MYDFLSKKGLSVALGLGFFISIVTIILFMTVEGDISNVDVAIYNEDLLSATGFGMVCTYIIGFACAVLAITLPLLNMIMNDPKKLMGPVIAIGALVVLYLIGWAMADDAVKPILKTEFGLTASGSKAVGGAIIMMYIMAFLTVLSAIYAEVSKAFK